MSQPVAARGQHGQPTGVLLSTGTRPAERGGDLGHDQRLYTDMIGLPLRQKYFARHGSQPGNSQAGLACDRIWLGG